MYMLSKRELRRYGFVRIKARPERPLQAGGLPHLGEQGYAELIELAAGDIGPTAGAIDLQVGLPVVDGPQHVAAALAQQGEIEVRVAIARIDAEGGLVAELGFGQVRSEERRVGKEGRS